MQQTWLVLAPPVLVLTLAFITRNVILSLLSGIVCAAFIATDFNLVKTVSLTVSRLWEQTDIPNLISGGTLDHMYIFAFLTVLGILITLISHSGGAAAYGRVIKKYIHDARSAESASLMLSSMFIIDDYFSSLTVGCVMRPLTDQFKIPRAKLAFLIDAMAAPLVILVPVSSWVAYLTAQFISSGVSMNAEDNPLIFADPFYVYSLITPFIFYSFIIVAAVWFIVRKRISFGAMYKQEVIAQKTGNLFGGKKPITEHPQEVLEFERHKGTLADFLVPLGSLIVTVFGALVYTGNWCLIGGINTLCIALRNADIFFALFVGSICALVISLIFFVITRRFTLSELPGLLKTGSLLMATTLLIILLAWTLSSLLKDDLATGQYLAQLLLNKVTLGTLPFIFFCAAALTSIATGSSWGTVAVLVPIALQMLMTFLHVSLPGGVEHLGAIVPSLGAILSGAVAGDHISPISDTTVMSATSSECYHIDHVQTQFSYAMPALVGTGAAYLVAGHLQNFAWYISSGAAIAVGISVTLTILWLLNKNK